VYDALQAVAAAGSIFLSWRFYKYELNAKLLLFGFHFSIATAISKTN